MWVGLGWVKYGTIFGWAPQLVAFRCWFGGPWIFLSLVCVLCLFARCLFEGRGGPPYPLRIRLHLFKFSSLFPVLEILRIFRRSRWSRNYVIKVASPRPDAQDRSIWEIFSSTPFLNILSTPHLDILLASVRRKTTISHLSKQWIDFLGEGGWV